MGWKSLLSIFINFSTSRKNMSVVSPLRADNTNYYFLTILRLFHHMQNVKLLTLCSQD